MVFTQDKLVTNVRDATSTYPDCYKFNLFEITLAARTCCGWYINKSRLYRLQTNARRLSQLERVTIVKRDAKLTHHNSTKFQPIQDYSRNMHNVRDSRSKGRSSFCKIPNSSRRLPQHKYMLPVYKDNSTE